MMQDDDYEEFLQSPERIKALGFKPQKEIVTNHVLPYADELDEESQRFLEEVKTNLAKAVMLREMKPACGVWTSRLMKYLRLYGLKFGKEDHIALIKLAYELIIIPDLEPCKVQKFATLFIMLTKRHNLLTPDELSLPWRPLYDMGKRLFDKNSLHIGMYHFIARKRDGKGKQEVDRLDIVRKLISGSGLGNILNLFGVAAFENDDSGSLTTLEGTYVTMVKCAKPYFEVTATKEILAELLPQIMPWSVDSHAMCQFVLFIPVTLHPKDAAQGHELWFEELMSLWDMCHNSQVGIGDFLRIFAGLAKRNPGTVDWSPHVSKFFTRFLHTLNLPVTYNDMYVNQQQVLDTKQISVWIVWTINPDGLVLKHLRSFLGGVESYLQSANSGRWSYKLRDLLRKLCREFLHRVRRESEKRFKESWENQTPEHYKLRDEDITEFVKILFEPLLQTVYSRNGSTDISGAIQNLATLRPAIVIPPLIDLLMTALTSLTEPHRVTAAMTAVAAVARPLLRGPEAGYPEGPTHVAPLLMAILPGIDPNDLKKTVTSLHFILMYALLVPLIDCSSAHEYWSDLTEEELLTCESTAQFEDFVLIYFERLFVIIESSVLEHIRLESKESDGVKSKNDTAVEIALLTVTTPILMQCSPKIFKEALRKFKVFATQSTFEPTVSGNMIGILLRVFARVDSELTLAAFVPQLCEELRELLTDEALHDENPPREITYRLVLLLHVVECNGVVLLNYIPDILSVLDRALKMHATSALNRACEILSHMLTSLSCVDINECRSSPKDYADAPAKWLPIREWGHGCLLKNVDFKWHVPCAEEAECAQMLLDRYLKHERDRLRQWLNGERDMSRERRLRSFYIITAMLSCVNFLPQPDEEPVILMESQVPATNIPYTKGVKYAVTIDGENVRAAVTQLLVDVQARLLADKTDDTKGLELLLTTWERLVVMKISRNGPPLELRLRSFAAMDRVVDGRGAPENENNKAASARSRMLSADAARLQDEARIDLVCEAGITPTALKALNAFLELSVNRYSTIRMLAQVRLYWMLNHYPFSYRVLVPKLIDMLTKGGEGDEWHARHKGVLFILLGPKNTPIPAKQDWETARAIWPAILKSPLSEKLIIMRLEVTLSDVIHRNFPTLNTRLTMSQSSVDAAKPLLSDSQLSDPGFAEQLNQAVEKEIIASDKTEMLYRELVNELVDVLEMPNVKWHRLELAMQMLTYCPSMDTAYPARAVRAVSNALIHDDVAVRRFAMRLMHYMLKQRKCKVRKISVDPYEIAGVAPPEKRVPGYRKDLEWAMWSEDRIPSNDEEWDRPWLRSPLCGFYTWPKKLTIAAPISEQECSKFSTPENMEEGDRYIYEFFNDDTNLNRLVSFLTVDEKKGKDRFNPARFYVFRMVFARFGPPLTLKLLDRVKEHAVKPQEDSQRFVTEVLTGAMRATRYWKRDDAMAVYNAALDILAAGLNAVTPESMDDWGTCLATVGCKMDPNRGAVVIKRVLDICLPAPVLGDSDPNQDTSFSVSAKLYALQCFLSSMKWRVAPLATEVLERLEAANFIQHPYQNVREHVGAILMMLFDTELVLPGGQPGPTPKLVHFLQTVQPRLAALYDENGDIVIKSASVAAVHAANSVGPRKTPRPLHVRMTPMIKAVDNRTDIKASAEGETPAPGPEVSAQAAEGEESPGGTGGTRGERNELMDEEVVSQLQSALTLTEDAVPSLPPLKAHARALNLLTTVLRVCIGVVSKGANAGASEGAQGEVAAYALVPAACACVSRITASPQEELPRAAGTMLAVLSLAYHSPEGFDRALATLDQLAAGRSWWTRLACIDFAQPLLFYGLPYLCEEPERAERAENFTLRLMRDARLEVRQSASRLLTGLMHCGALRDEEAMVRSLMKSCRSKELVTRHYGVLGLCAYVSSRPYSIASRLGDVLAELSRHTSAPDPVPGTIRLALADFRRTHQDDWPKHREKLTEDELDLLADLTSPPSYCA